MIVVGILRLAFTNMLQNWTAYLCARDAEGNGGRAPHVALRATPAQPSTYWRLATLTQQRQLRFRGTDARHDAIEVDQSNGFIPSCGFLHAHLRMVPPPALSGAKPIFDMKSRLVEAV
jgi:hypothetical protein